MEEGAGTKMEDVQKEIIIGFDDVEGKFALKGEPYATINVETKEDYETIENALNIYKSIELKCKEFKGRLLKEANKMNKRYKYDIEEGLMQAIKNFEEVFEKEGENE